MPTYSAISLDRLVDPGASKSMTTTRNVPIYRQGKRDTNSNKSTERVFNSKHDRRNSIPTTQIDQKQNWVRITPALYATPEPTPLPDSPSSFPPSPYIVNHKRRGPRLLKSYSEYNVNENGKNEKNDKNVENNEGNATSSVNDENPSFSFSGSVEAEHVNGIEDRNFGDSNLDINSSTQNGLVVENCETEFAGLSLDVGGLDDFFDPQDSMSAKSNTEGEGGSVLDRSLYHSTPMAEFYDAWEELSTESGPQLPLRDIEAELREMRLSLLMEIEKRKQADEILDNMRTQWLIIHENLALVGIKLPADPIATTPSDQIDFDLAEELSNQLYLARFVSNSIGRGTAKAEVEMEMEARLDSKNFEIARLCDRLQYYEAVNREMSQRNQETMEIARRLRQKRKRRQRWVWAAIAATITLGSGALAWSYMSTGNESSSTPDYHDSDHDILHK